MRWILLFVLATQHSLNRPARQHERCEGETVCAKGLECTHRSTVQFKTCEMPCSAQKKCPAGQTCQKDGEQMLCLPADSDSEGGGAPE